MSNLKHSVKNDRNGRCIGWQARNSESYGPLWPDLLLEPSKGRRLRIGYLSADFCNHPVGRFLLPILKHHDRQKVEIWGISCGPSPVTGLVNISRTIVNTGWIVDFIVM